MSDHSHDVSVWSPLQNCLQLFFGKWVQRQTIWVSIDIEHRMASSSYAQLSKAWKISQEGRGRAVNGNLNGHHKGSKQASSVIAGVLWATGQPRAAPLGSPDPKLSPTVWARATYVGKPWEWILSSRLVIFPVRNWWLVTPQALTLNVLDVTQLTRSANHPL